MGPRASLGKGAGGRGFAHSSAGCAVPHPQGRLWTRFVWGWLGALCQPPPFSHSSSSKPEMDGAGPLVGRCQVLPLLLLVLPPLLESLDNGMPKAKRRVPDCAGRGTALDLCKGLSRRAPQEQLGAADPLVVYKMLSDSLCPALHTLTLKGCALLTWE